MPFAGLIHDVPATTPRLLLNLEAVGEGRPGFRFGAADNYRDVLLLAKCDAGVNLLVEELGWQEEFSRLLEQHGVSSGAEPLDGAVCKNWRLECPELPGVTAVTREWTGIYPGVDARQSEQFQIDLRLDGTADGLEVATCYTTAWCLEQCHQQPRPLEVGSTTTIPLNQAEEEGEQHEVWLTHEGSVVARIGPLGALVVDRVDELSERLKAMGFDPEQLRAMGITEETLAAKAKGLL